MKTMKMNIHFEICLRYLRSLTDKLFILLYNIYIIYIIMYFERLCYDSKGKCNLKCKIRANENAQFNQILIDIILFKILGSVSFGYRN